jgi:hypothetical protein
MSIDDEMLMAYADGELDPLAAKRVERAIAADPALAERVEHHRALRARIAAGFAPVAGESVPDRLSGLLRSNVAPLARPAPRLAPSWRQATAAMAACLVMGLILGLAIQPRGPVRVRDGGLYAAGELAQALDDQPGGAAGATRVAVSFRDRRGTYCRVFSAAAADGIACRDAVGWALRRTRPGTAVPATSAAYVQAGSADADLMAAAQDMMAGAPLDAAGEAEARARGWH